MVGRVAVLGLTLIALLTAVALTDSPQLMLVQTSQGPTFGTVSGSSFLTCDGQTIPLASLPTPVPVQGSCASPSPLPTHPQASLPSSAPALSSKHD
jgi:hypothetical protein